MRKIALALVVQGIFISSSVQAEIDAGYQIVSDIKIKYPKEFAYSDELTSRLQGRLETNFSKSELKDRTVLAYIAEPVCNLSSVTISETVLRNKPAVTAKQITKGTIDGMMSLPNVKIISSSVEKTNPPQLDSTRGYTVLNKGGAFIYYDVVNANNYDNNKMIQITFIGTTKKENEVKEMQKCATDFINSIEYNK